MTPPSGGSGPADPEALARDYAEVGAAAAAGTRAGSGRCPTCGEPTLRVGTDVQAVAPVLEAVRRHGTRYLERVFTPDEVADSLGTDDGWSAVSAASLAGRYAVKEAVVKALRPVHTGVPWPMVEVVRQPGGWCTLRLHGDAARRAGRAGLDAWSISFAHEADTAVATVVVHHVCR
ncbi:hypothetical protein ASG49_14565 [Marmoricola sp. Leaf446]|uniref:holo-ACP synthase n=1 Tax=Marmoricola sp. Leaf446 TaxID=1736379 RepID=UPI0006F45EB7|nr:4'-phosphopantetheinyl transferase superfamily protein [Marmoricola sp. Leaf446]KQT90931.1 hypothetical protein ASG49_14565 [Marmoricola sp. Leaf446]